MCGILGFFTTETAWATDRKAFLEQGLIVDTLRGEDSTGIGLLHGSKYSLYKKAMAGPDFVNTKRFSKLLGKNMGNTTVAIGHNRAATKGVLCDENAHPFKIGNTILTHNGTLNFTYHNAPEGYDSFDVDSEFICHSIDTIGLEKTVPLLSGAFALAWIDLEDKSLNLFRNNQRPIYFANVFNESTVVYGSEKGMLRWLAERNKINYKEDKIYELTPGHWLKFLPENKGKFTHKQVPLYSYTPTNSHNSRDRMHRVLTKQQMENKLKASGLYIGDTITYIPKRIWDTKSYFDSEGSIAKLSDIDFEGVTFDRLSQSTIKSSGINKIYDGTIDRLIFRNNHIAVILRDLAHVKPRSTILHLPDNNAAGDTDEKKAVLYPGPAGTWVEEDEIKKWVDGFKGCSCCGDAITKKDYSNIVWTDEGEPACYPCSISRDWKDQFSCVGHMNPTKVH